MRVPLRVRQPVSAEEVQEAGNWWKFPPPRIWLFYRLPERPAYQLHSWKVLHSSEAQFSVYAIYYPWCSPAQDGGFLSPRPAWESLPLPVTAEESYSPATQPFAISDSEPDGDSASPSKSLRGQHHGIIVLNSTLAKLAWDWSQCQILCLCASVPLGTAWPWLLSSPVFSRRWARALILLTGESGTTLVAKNEWVLCIREADGSSINWGEKMMLFPEQKHQVLCCWGFRKNLETTGLWRNLWVYFYRPGIQTFTKWRYCFQDNDPPHFGGGLKQGVLFHLRALIKV